MLKWVVFLLMFQENARKTRAENQLGPELWVQV